MGHISGPREENGGIMMFKVLTRDERQTKRQTHMHRQGQVVRQTGAVRVYVCVCVCGGIRLLKILTKDE